MILPIILAHFLYSWECCHEKDCRPVPCAEITDLGNGWMWRDKQFTKAMLRVSPDGACHVCTSVQPICIYLPPRV